MKEVLSITPKDEEGRKVYYIAGPLDENCDLTLLLQDSHADLNLDVQGLTKINSIGIKNWVSMLLKSKQKQVFIHRCSIRFINQINLLPEFIGHAEIKSLYLPYYCESCDEEEDCLITIDQAKDENFVQNLDQQFKCKSCNEYLSFNDDDQIYFFFLTKP